MKPAAPSPAPVTVVTPEATRRSPGLLAMNFLNEATTTFPAAISFAAGRPPDQFLDVSPVDRWLKRYAEYRASTEGVAEADVLRALGQYGPTNGQIGDLIAEYLKVEEGLSVVPDACMLTNGFQEALLVLLLDLARQGGAVLTADPTYIGLAGAAMLAGVTVVSFRRTRSMAADVEAACREAEVRGIAPRAMYVIPDHGNPSGEVLSLDERCQLLDVARSRRLSIYEDTAYRIFTYDGERLPSLSSLDRDGRVVYLGTFSKMFLPGLRAGFMASAGPADVGPSGGGASCLSAIKSFVSVMTAPVVQAIVAGFLLEVGFRVTAWNADRIAWCRNNRDQTLAALAATFPEGHVSWSRPQGGFFVVVSLPFPFAESDLADCARHHGVIVTPMSFFSASGASSHDVRLAFGNLDPPAIREGIARFGEYVRGRARS